VTLDGRESNLARYTDHWLQPVPGREGMLLQTLALALVGKRIGFKSIAKNAGVEEERLRAAVALLKDAEHLAVILGPMAFEYTANTDLLDGIIELAKRPDTVFMPLYNGANLRGALELGAFGEFLPGLVASEGQGLTLDDVLKAKKTKVLYLVGQAPFLQRPDCDFLICQDIYYPPFPVDAFLPAASFAEAGGTLTNIEGRVQEIAKIENLPDGAVTGFTRPDWKIFSELAREMGNPDLQYESAEEIIQEIHKNVPGFPAGPDRKPRQIKTERPLAFEKKDASPEGKGDFLLVIETAGFQHRGIDLSYVVEGLGELALERGLRMNPDDMAKMGIKAGDAVTVSLNGNKMTTSARRDPECRAGVAYLYRPINLGGLAGCTSADFFSGLPTNPVKVHVKTEG
jgi:predicted molibdopterin-dependent oxidoreductase YjgC